MEVPDVPFRGSAGGRGAESLLRGRSASPSSGVPPSADVMPPINVSVLHSVASLGLDRFSGSPYPPLGDSTPVNTRLDQLRDRGDSGLTQHAISADVHSVPRSMSSFDPTSLLFPFSDSGFSSFPPPTPSLPSFSSSSVSVSLLSSTAPSSTVPIFLLPFIVPSVLSTPSVPSTLFPSLSSFSQFPSSLPSFSFSTAPLLQPSAPPLVSSSVSSSFPLSSALSSHSSSSPWLSSVPPASSSSGVSSCVSSVSSSTPTGDFASYQAKVLGLSEEYQALGRWFFASGVSNFPAYLSSHFPCLYSDFRLDFSFGSSRFLSALAASPPPPPPSSSAPTPSLRPPFLAPSAPLVSAIPVSSSSSFALSFPYSVRPVDPVSSSAPSFPPAPLSSFPPAVSTAPLFPFPLSAHRPSVPSAPLGVPGSSGGCFGSSGSCASCSYGLCSFSLSPFCLGSFYLFLTRLFGSSSSCLLQSSFFLCFCLCLSGLFRSS